MYCMPIAFLLDGLLIVHEPHTPAVLVCVENCLILNNQHMFFFPWVKCGGDALECLVIIRSHKT